MATATEETQAPEEPQPTIGESFAANLEANATPEASDAPVESTPEPESSPATEQPVAEEQSPLPSDAPEQTQPPTILDRMAELGYTNLGDDPDEAVERLFTGYEQMNGQLRQMQEQLQASQALAPIAQQYQQFVSSPEYQEFQQWKTGAAQQPQQQQQPQEFGPGDFDMSRIQQYVVTDPQTGESSLRPDTPLPLRQEFDDYRNRLQQWETQLFRRPQEAFKAAGLMTREDVESILQEHRQQEQQQWSQAQHVQFANQMLEQNAEWMLERDARSGQYMQTPNGSFAYSPMGQMQLGFIEQASQLGINDPQARWNYAMDQLELHIARQNQQNQPNQPDPNAINEQKKAEHLQAGNPSNGARRIPSAAGSVPTNEEPASSQNPRMRVGDKLRANLPANFLGGAN